MNVGSKTHAPPDPPPINPSPLSQELEEARQATSDALERMRRLREEQEVKPPKRTGRPRGRPRKHPLPEGGSEDAALPTT